MKETIEIKKIKITRIKDGSIKNTGIMETHNIIKNDDNPLSNTSLQKSRIDIPQLRFTKYTTVPLAATFKKRINIIYRQTGEPPIKKQKYMIGKGTIYKIL